MSFKIAVYRKLVSLGLTPKIYYRELPQNPSYPATVYSLISQAPVDLTHDVGVTGFRQARFQIDAYALTVAQAETAIEAYFEALKSFSGVLSDGLSPETTYDCDIWDEGRNPDQSFNDSTLRHIEGRSHDFMIHF
jgi:hypothetical protein